MQWNEDVLRRAETVIVVVVIALILLAYLISKVTTEQRHGFSFNVPEWRGTAVSLGELVDAHEGPSRPPCVVYARMADEIGFRWLARRRVKRAEVATPVFPLMRLQ